MIIHGLNKTTLLDFPGIVACTVFTGGCNLRCIYCQNSSLILNPSLEPAIPEDDFFAFLKKRRNVLKGVCITGGEPTLSRGLKPFIQKIKDMGFLVKLDTNGLHPEIIKDLLSCKLIDYIAMDIKGPLEDYNAITQIHNIDLSLISESIDTIINSSIQYEFRTTVVAGYFTASSFEKIGDMLKGADAYFIQCYKDSDLVLCQNLSAPSDDELTEYLNTIKKYIPNAALRGVDI